MQDLNDKVNNGGATAAGQLDADEWNQVPSEIQNVIEGLGITLSGGDLNQLGKAIAGYAANGAFYTDGGVADAYVLSVIGSKQAPTAYTDGMIVEFLAGNDNTGASTVNVAGLGLKNIVGTSNGGEIRSGARIELRYRSGSGDFEIVSSNIISGTPIATTSGTSHDFTGIPSFAKKIIIMFEAVSTNGTSDLILQIGDSGGVEVTGYLSRTSNFQGTTAQTTGYAVTRNTAAVADFNGALTLFLLDASTNTWILDGTINDNSVGAQVFSDAGSKSLSGILDRIRLTTVGGTDTFDAGKINILYE